MKFIVQTRRDDLRSGQQTEGDSCAIALRMKKDGFERPFVAQDQISFTLFGRHFTRKTPKAVARWISAWDKNKNSVKPISFVLDVPVNTAD